MTSDGPTSEPAGAGLHRRVVQERIGAAVLVAFSAAVLFESIGYGLFRGTQPGPGLVPLIVAAILLVLGTLWFVLLPGVRNTAYADAGRPQPAPGNDAVEAGLDSAPRIDHAGAVRIALIFGWALFPIVLMDRIGFVLTMIPYVTVMIVALSRRRWWLILSITTVSVFLVQIGAGYVGLYLPDPLGIFTTLGIW